MSTIDHDTQSDTDTDPGPAPADRVALKFLRAVIDRNRATTARLLAPNVWFRALLPRQLSETHTAADAERLFDEWLGEAENRRVLEVAHHTVMGREHIRYRLALLPSWDPDQWHVIEQSGQVRVQDGQITRIDLVCTGYWPVDEPPASGVGTAA